VRNGTTIYRFGAFELDTGQRLLTREGRRIQLPDRQFDLLVVFLSNPGRIISKNELIKKAWGVSVSDSSVEVAISNLRHELGDREDETPYIETHIRRGYRFSAEVRCEQVGPAVDDELAPHESFINGVEALVTLRLDVLPKARDAFSKALQIDPDYVPALIGISNVEMLEYESTRADLMRDRAPLENGLHHAERACELDGSAAEAWSALSFAADRRGDARRAGAAVRKAIRLQPRNWHHRLRHATVSWGEESIDAAEMALSRCPRLGFAHWCIARVLIARQAFGPALEQLEAGCAVQDAQRADAGGFHAVGLHALRGFVLARLGRFDEALEQFARERAAADPLPVSGRECCATTAYGLGAIYLRLGRPEQAEPELREALKYVPTHGLAAVGLAAISPSARRDLADLLDHLLDRLAVTVEWAMVKAAVLSLCNKHHEGARVYTDALAVASPGSAGWQMPIDPLIDALGHVDAWAQALAMLHDRAL
jgi:DNA-binding winged helix-turn-helix (wHTH) protein